MPELTGACGCEHGKHFPDLPNHYDPNSHEYCITTTLTHMADFVGAICAPCAETCIPGFTYAELFTTTDGQPAVRYLKDDTYRGIAKGSELLIDPSLNYFGEQIN